MVRVIGVAEIVLFILILSVLFYVYFVRATDTRKRRQDSPSEIDWEAANTERVRSLLPHSKIEAIKVYRELTGASLKTAKTVIEYLIDNPDDYGDEDKEKTTPRDAGIRDLIRQGHISEAIEIYKHFTGVTLEAAAEDIAQIQQELELEDHLDEADSTQNTRRKNE